jgi:hypothetical protein
MPKDACIPSKTEVKFTILTTTGEGPQAWESCF